MLKNKNIIMASLSCLVCVNTYVSESSEEDDDNIGDSKVSKHEKNMVKLKGWTKIDYGIWAYEKIAPLEETHWIKQPELFKSAVTVIGDAISACFANSDEFALHEDKKPKDLITFAADPKGYDRSNWNAFICWNLINEIVKLSMKEQKIDINKVFKDIKTKALAHYENANIENLETKLDTSIGDISEYNRVLDLSGYLEQFRDTHWFKVNENQPWYDCDPVIVSAHDRNLSNITYKDVKKGNIWVEGDEKNIAIKAKDGYTYSKKIRKAYGLRYPIKGEFLGNGCSFTLNLQYDSDKNVWRTIEVGPFKKIRYITKNEQEIVQCISYDMNHISGLSKNIDALEKFMFNNTYIDDKDRRFAHSWDAARYVVNWINHENKQMQKTQKKILNESDFYAPFHISAWKGKAGTNKARVERDLKKFLEPIGIELGKIFWL